jgi:hypothetical protein
MAWTAPRTWVTGEVLSKTNLDTHVRDNLNYLKLNIALETATELTLDTDGEVTKVYSHHTIDTFEDAASDDLVTINGGAEGEIILVRPASGDRTVTLKHATGNIWNPALEDIVLDDAGDYCFLIFDGSNWCAISGGLSESAVNDLIAAHAALDTGVHGAGESTLATAADITTHASDNDAHHTEDHASRHKNSGDDELLLHELGEPTSSVDINLQQLLKVRIENLAEEPAYKLGRLYYNTANKKAYLCREQ